MKIMRSKMFLTRRTKIEIFIVIAFVGVLLGYLIYQIGGYKIAYATNPHAMRYKLNCGNIPLEEQGENCSILRAKVLK